LTNEHVERRLAAILAADVAGYSRLMGADEEGTLARLKAIRRSLFDPAITTHRGRIVKTTGDGMLVEFASAVEAVRCAVEVQRGRAMQSADVAQDLRIEFRIGIHVGDIIIDDDDIFGDGVNIAARLEGIAEPGGVCISDDAQRQIRGKVDIAFEDMGPQDLKNIIEPMRAWRLRIDAKSSALLSPKPSIETAQPLPLPDKPSIAVLPFQNMSGDPEQEYFADGMVEEIITALSRFHWLFVIARTSTFTYKGRAVDVKQIGRELGVRYVLEGSVRKAANRLRITGQLVEASTGVHLWADRFEGGVEDVFDLQDQVTASVVGAIAPRLGQAEIDRTKRKPTESLDAYDYFLRGMANVHRWTREANNEALQNFRCAIERDPEFASAYGLAARCYSQRKECGWMADRLRETAEAERLARLAAEFGKDDAIALCTAGIALAYVVGNLDDGDALIDQALVLNPSLAWAWVFGSWVKIWLGEADVAMERGARAMRLSPNEPEVLFYMQTATAYSHFLVGRYAEALSWAQTAMRQRPNFVISICAAAASGALAGRVADAQEAMASLRQLAPALRIADLKELFPFRRRDDSARWAEGLRKAGLPE
jgi:TolB-like protein/class 3 adenylate cyclase